MEVEYFPAFHDIEKGNPCEKPAVSEPEWLVRKGKVPQSSESVITSQL